jgi:hypothetical protein
VVHVILIFGHNKLVSKNLKKKLSKRLLLPSLLFTYREVGGMAPVNWELGWISRDVLLLPPRLLYSFSLNILFAVRRTRSHLRHVFLVL